MTREISISLLACMLTICMAFTMTFSFATEVCYAKETKNNQSVQKEPKKTSKKKTKVTKVKTVSVTGVTCVQPGKSYKLTAEVKPDKATNKKLKWSSSDKAVATVDTKGRVKSIAPGTAKITAKATDGSGKKGSIVITVYSLGRNDVQWVAHRGLKSEAIENTAAAFELAGINGFWGAECDIWETKHTGKDFDIVISHDPDFTRLYNVDKLIKETTAQEIIEDERLESVCFFREYLEICGRYDMVPVVELKDPEATEEGLRREIDMIYSVDKGRMLKKTWLVSFYADILKRACDYSRWRYGITPVTSYIIGESNIGDGMSAIEEAESCRFSGISIKKELMLEEYYDYCKEKGMSLGLWTYTTSVKSEDMLYRDLMQYDPDIVTVNGLVFD